MKKTEIEAKLEVIEYRLKVLECDHHTVEFKSIYFMVGGNKHYTECSDCGKTLKDYKNEIELQKDKVAYKERELEEENTRLFTLLNEGKKEK